MQTAAIKQEAYRLIEQLPNNASWDDLMYEIYVHQTIKAGLQDSEANRVVDVSEARKQFGLSA